MGGYSLKDKYVLVTGASSGIGKEMSRAFAAEGAHCVLGALPSEMEMIGVRAAELRRDFGVKTWTAPFDLSEKYGPEQVYGRVLSAVPHLDVLVNNAGMMIYGNFHETDAERLERLFLVNARAYMVLMRLFLPHMVARRQGTILNISSVSAFQPCAHHALYGATKAFIQSLSEAIARELQGTGVRVCTLNPSYTDTPMLKGDDFPKKLWWYYISGLSNPAAIARHGVRAVKRGKMMYVPGIRNRIIHLLLPRLLPKRLAGFISYFVLQSVKGQR